MYLSHEIQGVNSTHTGKKKKPDIKSLCSTYCSTCLYEMGEYPVALCYAAATRWYWVHIWCKLSYHSRQYYNHPTCTTFQSVERQRNNNTKDFPPFKISNHKNWPKGKLRARNPFLSSSLKQGICSSFHNKNRSEQSINVLAAHRTNKGTYFDTTSLKL